MHKEYPGGDLLGSIVSDRGRAPSIENTLIDPAIEDAVAQMQAKYDKYDPDIDTGEAEDGPFSRRSAYSFREQFGSTVPGDTKLFMLLSEERSGDMFASIGRVDKNSIAAVLNRLSRISVTTVGALREANIAAIMSNPRLNLGFTVKQLVFAQSAFRKSL